MYDVVMMQRVQGAIRMPDMCTYLPSCIETNGQGSCNQNAPRKEAMRGSYLLFGLVELVEMRREGQDGVWHNPAVLPVEKVDEH